METAKLIAAIGLALFALTGLLAMVGIIMIIRAVRKGATLTFGYNESDEEEYGNDCGDQGTC